MAREVSPLTVGMSRCNGFILLEVWCWWILIAGMGWYNSFLLVDGMIRDDSFLLVHCTYLLGSTDLSLAVRSYASR